MFRLKFEWSSYQNLEVGKEEALHLKTLSKRQSKAYGTKIIIKGTCCNMSTVENHFLKTVNNEHSAPLDILVSLTVAAVFP